MHTSSTAHTVMALDSIDLGAAVEGGLTAVDVHHSSVYSAVQSGPELIAQLVGEKDAGSNHKHRQRALRGEQTALQVLDHDKGLATACGHMHLTMRGIGEGIERTLLVRAKCEGHRVVVSDSSINAKRAHSGALGTVVKVAQVARDHHPPVLAGLRRDVMLTVGWKYM
jgi:hypothetical protein